ncbi:MAG: excinuclease ABC subunit UvrB [Methylacidiphilales bacterium]|nr:excinuclease ABC subunit UvrB [Candidatus Methylacidiphilales bacterium]
MKREIESDTSSNFNLRSTFACTPAQKEVIDAISHLILVGNKFQTLKGVTGCGKTFIMASVIAEINKPAIIIAPNKILAAQLFEEFKVFFPNNSVEFFVSYYDYYQPEAYVPGKDLFIEKDSSINQHIDQMRLSATKSLLERKDVVIVASVSAIYGLGDPSIYQTMLLHLVLGDLFEIEIAISRLIAMQYVRNDIEFNRGVFRVRGESLDVYPAEHEDMGIRIIFDDIKIVSLYTFDPLTGVKIQDLRRFSIYPKTHYVSPRDNIHRAIIEIKNELRHQIDFFSNANKLIEAQRIEQRTVFDIEMLSEIGYCSGIENYSRHLSRRNPGEAPPCLLDYLPKDGVLFVDESHLTISQIQAMYKGDHSRKKNLVDYGFRLPSALDNRPLRFDEFESVSPRTVYVSATPAEYELSKSSVVHELLVRPTGLLDPVIEVMPAKNQIETLLIEIKKEIEKNHRVLVGCLTKVLSEKISEFLNQKSIKTHYIHADTNTTERISIIHDLRIGTVDVLVGINLLREGLDLPEVGLVALLDADREGFLRSERSLVQTIGRAARNVNGRVILFADSISPAMDRAITESNRRRSIQSEYNIKHSITPTSVKRTISNTMDYEYHKQKLIERKMDLIKSPAKSMTDKEFDSYIKQVESQMVLHASKFEFEKAIECREKLKSLIALRTTF